MGRLFGIVMILATLWLALRVYQHGLSGLYTPAVPVAEDVGADDDDADVDDADADEKPAAEPAHRQARPRTARVPITEYVRRKATRDIQHGAERRYRAVDR